MFADLNAGRAFRNRPVKAGALTERELINFGMIGSFGLFAVRLRLQPQLHLSLQAIACSKKTMFADCYVGRACRIGQSRPEPWLNRSW